MLTSPAPPLTPLMPERGKFHRRQMRERVTDPDDTDNLHSKANTT
jgi:hypothetical protein